MGSVSQVNKPRRSAGKRSSTHGFYSFPSLSRVLPDGSSRVTILQRFAGSLVLSDEYAGYSGRCLPRYPAQVESHSRPQ